MKIATILVRTLIGLILIFASVAYFFHLFPEPIVTGNFKAFQVGLVASVYLIPMIKTVELLCGLSYISNRYVTLSNIVVLPVIINILFINFFLSPEGLPIAIFMFLGNLFLIYRHWTNYKSLFAI